MKVIAGNSNKVLAEALAKELKTTVADTNITTFADGEINVELTENLEDEDCVVLQSIASSAGAAGSSMNDNLLEMLLIIDALRRIPVKSIKLVVPYMGYARQDRRVFPQSPISSKVVANLITTVGTEAVVTMDIHAEQLLGFFDIPIKNAYALPVLLEDIRENAPDLGNTVLVAPDAGALKKTRFAAGLLGCPCVMVEKKRPKPGESAVMSISGDFEGKDCILLDDMIDSAGTLCNAAAALMERGAGSVKAYATHGIFSGKASERINASAFTEVVVTDTIDHTGDKKLSKKIRVLSVAGILADAVGRR